MCDGNGRYILVRQTCGPARAIPVDCGDPLCPYCEKARAAAIRERWSPVVKNMRYPVMLTLTLKDRSDLRDMIKYFHMSFRRLMDTRLGPNNRRKLLSEAKSFIREHEAKAVKDGKIEQSEADCRIRDWDKSLDKFNKRLEGLKTPKEKPEELPEEKPEEPKKKKKKKPKWYPRFRDVIGYGLVMTEITWSLDWHYHKHPVIDTYYLPWPYLVILWKRATNEQGEIIDIRPIGKTDKDLAEVFKYLTKSWEIPAEKCDELRDAVRGLKRVWPIGGAKPVEVVKPCPFCGEVTCRPHLVAMGEHAERRKALGMDILKFPGDPVGDIDRWFYLDKCGWRECAPEVVDLILRELACHSQSGAPPDYRPVVVGGPETLPLGI